MARSTAPASPLVVFSDDWGRHPSSSQHLVSRLLGSREVVWVETIGTRAPRLDAATARRVVEKLGRWTRPVRAASSSASASSSSSASTSTSPALPSSAAPAPPLAPRIVAPRMWPSFASGASRRLNRTLLARALEPELARLPADPIVVTTIPLVADLVGRLRARRWVYYCVDDFSVWPGYDGHTLGAMERELVPRMDTVICASEALADRMRALGADPRVLTHGVDVGAWLDGAGPPASAAPPDDSRRAPSLVRPPELAGLEGPFVMFWGVVDRRMDVEWVAELSRRMTAGTIVMLGPVEDPDPMLARLPRVALRPPVPFSRLAAIAAHASVLVMPYEDAPVTRAMQPLKLNEYLASGRPAVVRALPATRPWADACDVCDDAGAFAAAVLARIDGGVPASQALARARLADESWDGKARRFAELIDPLDEPRTRPHADDPMPPTRPMTEPNRCDA